MVMKVVQMRQGDPRCSSLLDALIEVVEERAIGMSAPSIIGVCDLLKDYIKADAHLEK